MGVKSYNYLNIWDWMPRARQLGTDSKPLPDTEFPIVCHQLFPNCVTGHFIEITSRNSQWKLLSSRRNLSEKTKKQKQEQTTTKNPFAFIVSLRQVFTSWLSTSPVSTLFLETILIIVNITILIIIAIVYQISEMC